MSKVSKKLDENDVPSKKAKIEEKIGPNILITGTPGVGKSALCQALIKTDPESIQWINIGSFAKEIDLLGDFDEVYQCHELEEDKIIDELEESKRKMYAGSIGYFSANKNFDTCIALRTALIKNNKFYIQSGAGIVADSVPEKEYEETVNKAKALINSLN